MFETAMLHRSLLAYLAPLKHVFHRTVDNGKFINEKYSWIQHQHESLNYLVKKIKL